MQTEARVLQADQVSYHYVREGCGLARPTSLSVVPGDLVLVTGPSGCGKSTLARCLVNYLVFGALGGFLGGLTLAGLRKARFFAYLAEKR